jgi:hypothetical protein
LNDKLTLQGVLSAISARSERYSERTQFQLERLAAETLDSSQDFDRWTPEAVQEHLQLRLLQRDRLIEFQENAKTLLDRLGQVGIFSHDILDLRNLHSLGPAVEDLLLAELSRTDYRPLQEAILSVLGSKDVSARVLGPLFEFFENAEEVERGDPNGLRWRVLGAIAAHVDGSAAPALIRIADDQRNGRARYLAVAALGSLSSERQELVPKLLGYLQSSDRTLNLPAARALGRWRYVAAAPRVHELLLEAEGRRTSAGLETDQDVDWLRKAYMQLSSP